MLIDTFLSKNAQIPPVEQNGDNKWRSVAKTISWRLVGTIDTIIISWLITGTIRLALSIGFVELISKMLLYYFHERTWNKIKWGKK
jgi:uncharacterized membrane protein